jgi:hypothetical protein
MSPSLKSAIEEFIAKAQYVEDGIANGWFRIEGEELSILEEAFKEEQKSFITKLKDKLWQVLEKRKRNRRRSRLDSMVHRGAGKL